MNSPKINLSGWQDYRGKSEGVLLYLNSPKNQELPVRDVLDTLGKGFETEPHYETGTLNFFSCKHSKSLNSILKNRRRYVFLGTVYEGTLSEYKNKLLLFGYYRLDKTLDVHKRHIHQYMAHPDTALAPECLNLTECFAAYSEEVKLFHPSESFELSEEIMKSWGYKGRVAKHMKLTFSPEQAEQVLNFFKTKTTLNEKYEQLVKDLESQKDQVLADRQAAKLKEENLW